MSYAGTRGLIATLLLGGIALLIISLPAFSAFFLAEDFTYLGQLRSHGDNFLLAVLSPTTGIFFRPVFSAVNLLWQLVLPLDPMAHHVRNYVFSVINVGLVYVLLAQLGVATWPRVIASLLFAISKVHLTAIGYINTYDSIISLTILLASLLLWLTYERTQQKRYYYVALAATFLAIFTKDYGLVAVAVVAAMLFARRVVGRDWRRGIWPWAIRLAPLVVMVAVYAATRYVVVGPLQTSDPSGSGPSGVYTLRFSPELAAYKSLLFTSTLGNFAFSAPDAEGAPGLGGWVANLPAVKGHIPVTLPEKALFAGFLLLVLGTLWAARRAPWRLLFPLVWVAAYFGPTLLTRNQQIYYFYEPLAGAAVLIGVALGTVNNRGLLLAWTSALTIIVVNGALSNFGALYTWQFATHMTQRIEAPILEAYRGQALDSITFATRSAPFWAWALTADGGGPMLPELLRQPRLRVRFAEYKDLRASTENLPDARHLVFDIDNGFQPITAGDQPPPLVLKGVSPPSAELGVGFNTQPDGGSALTINVGNATPGTRIVLGGHELPTILVGPNEMTVSVPPDMFTQPGTYSAYLTNGISLSNQIEFVVTPPGATAAAHVRSGPLLLDRLDPGGTRAGQPFAVQADGQSALSIQSQAAEPGTAVVFDGRPLPTFFGNDHWLTAQVPADMYARAGLHDVYLRFGEEQSNHLQFVVDG